MSPSREVVGCRNSGKFLKKFFENQRLFQWLFVKSTKISEKNLNIWNFSEFLQKLKIFVNKNTIKMENIKVPPYQRVFSVTFFSDFLKFLKSSWTNENFDYPLQIFINSCKRFSTWESSQFPWHHTREVVGVFICSGTFQKF